MIVRSVNITREGDWGYGAVDAAKPFRAKIKIAGQHGEIDLLVSPELSRRIVEVVAEEVAAAGRAAAEAMTAEVLNVAALPKPEAA